MTITLPAERAAHPGRGIMLMLLAVLGWVAMDTIGKTLVGWGIPVWQVTWARYAFHLAAMLPFVLAGRVNVRTTRPGLQVTRSLLLLVVTFLVYTALRFLPLATVNAIGFLTPLLITALSVPLLRERVGIRRWLAVAAGFAGVLILIRPSPAMHPAMLLPIAAALMNAFYQIATRLLSHTEPATTTLFWTSLVGFTVASAAVPFAWSSPDAWGWTLMVALGVLGCVSHYLMIVAYTASPAVVVAPFTYTQLIWVVPVGWFAFGDLPDLWNAVGAAIIVASGLYTFYREVRRGRVA
ncbi:DMT family transporter [Arenibaculum pallidiluteum]|uniref:DMT family transporter n=1 Tax=Arenibaculum pallidiluteum TaxID=2812559 RepID=UPI001A978E87|nr:DMT family transporter [Arenibaculum pallidiluteum]